MRSFGLSFAFAFLYAAAPCLAGVPQSIGMTSFGSPFDIPPKEFPAITSPDGRHDAFTVYAGDVSKDANVYHIITVDHGARHIGVPRTIFTLTTTDDGMVAGISELRWLDSRWLTALVVSSGGITRLIRIDSETGRWVTLTKENENVIDYAVSARGSSVALVRAGDSQSVLATPAAYAGRVIGSEEPYALMGDSLATYSRSGLGSSNNIVLREGSRDLTVQLPPGEWLMPDLGLSISPSGRFVIIPVGMARPQTPTSWLAPSVPTDWVFFFGLEIYDRDTGRLKWLIDEPTFWTCSTRPKWADDESAVFISSRFLRGTNGTLSAGGAILSPTSGQILSTTDGALEQLGGGERLNDLRLVEAANISEELDVLRDGGRWKFAPKLAEGSVIRLRQNMTLPPRLVWHDLVTGRERLLFNPNPDLRTNEVRVSQFTWTLTDGSAVVGGLFLPRRRQSGARLPLIIQTHGWDPNQFWYDGPSTAGFAARALAENGFAVLQIGAAPSHIALSARTLSAVDMIDTSIDALDRAGIIDTNRIGITAWSATGLAVRAALAFGRHHFAAAILVDSRDDGYFNYLLTGRELQDLSDGEMGGRPYGFGMEAWRTNSPMFNMDRVTTPVRLVALGPRVLAQWEQWASMKRLGKPIDFIWLPRANHRPVRPSERMEAQQGAIDWYRFWLLNGVAKSTPEISEQSRWNDLGKPLMGTDRGASVANSTTSGPHAQAH